jgi:PAS domain S-box-containing protein
MRSRWGHFASLAIAAFGGLALAVLWGAMLGQEARERAETERATYADVSNLARAFDEHVQRSFRMADHAILALRREYENNPQDFTRTIRDFQNLAFDILLQVAIIGKDGRMVFSDLAPVANPIDLSDREHFIVHRDSQQDALFISKPVMGRVSKKWSLQFTRRLRDRDGNFAGVIVLSFDPGYFSRFYETAEFNVPTGLTLIGQDRVIRARFAKGRPPDEAYGKEVPPERPFFSPASPPVGTYVVTEGIIDKVERMAAYRRLATYPMVVVASVAADDVFKSHIARWNFLRIGVIATSLLIIAFCLGMIWLMLRQARIQEKLRESESHLIESEKHFRAMADGAPVMIWVSGVDKGCIWFNKARLDFTGRELAKEMGTGWVENVHHEDVSHCQEIYYHSFDLRQPFRMEYRMRRHDGLFRWVVDSGQPRYSEDGEFLGFIGSSLDITEMRAATDHLTQTKRRLEKVLASAGEGIIGTDREGRITFVNHAACSMLGWDEKDFIGREAHASFHHHRIDGSPFPRSECKAWQALERHEERVVGSDFYWTRQGTSFPVEYIATLLPNDEGSVLVFRNVAEQKRWEAELHRKADELVRSNAELEAFAYAASHDLREPLRMVTSYLTLLERRLQEKLDQDTREFLDFARDGAKRMDQLIVDLLEYSRVGRRERPFEAVGLGEIMAEAERMLSVALSEAQGSLSVDDHLPTVLGDRDELTRLFLNLVGNAVKYRDKSRPPNIEISTSLKDGEWVIRVADNGIGIPPEQLDRVFGIFQRLHGRDEYEGTGIGLALCKKIVQHHGGRIWAESKPDEGCSFFVALPSIATKS